MLQFGLTRNKDNVILRPKIDKRNKRLSSRKGPPPLALENQISAPSANCSIYGHSVVDDFNSLTILSMALLDSVMGKGSLCLSFFK